MKNPNRRALLLAAAAGALPTSARAERVNALRLKFNIEARVPLAGLYTPAPLTFPQEISSALAAGELEIRARYNFPLDDRDILGIQILLVPPSAPYPLPAAPAASDPSGVAYFEVEIHELQTVDRPNASIAIVGPVVRTPGSPFGDLSGVLSYLSFQYLPGTPLRFRAVFGGSVGVITTNAPSGVGTLEWNYRMP